MKISARNVFKGKVVEVKPGNVNTEVIIEIPGGPSGHGDAKASASGMQIVAMISKDSAAHLGLKKGKTAYAVIKASSVMVAID
ncbi:MAG: TOBE domain-containing protein [Candidatus Aminicenantes bacterium]|nr:TOBE domain-containing protein [Candidatus Aminicenantes bacterium]